MYQKKFVSIYFTSDRIQVVKLNSKKDTVVKYATFGFPEGTIINHKVADAKLLSETIRRIWDQMKLREKAVGLIVPEFSTFTKTLKLPDLSEQELDEAVRWQATEQLPFEKDTAILDWKIIVDSEVEKTVLVSAISSDALTGYVDAVSAAGLFPLSVETPSLSLIRILDKQDKNRLIIYRGNSEAIMLVTKGQSIIGSSVLGTNDEQSAIRTATQIAYHYAHNDIAEIYVGGYSYGQDFYNELQQSFKGVQPQHFNQQIQGVSTQVLQEYLVPISLQMEEPQAPEDEHSINLLPPGWVKHYQDQLLTRQAWAVSWITSLLILICLGITLSAYLFLTTQLNSLRAQHNVTSPENEEILSTVNDANTFLKNIAGIASYELYPQTYINVVTAAKPPGVTINSYDLSLEGGSMTITGVAQRRQDLLSFRDELEKSGFYKEVDVPISSLIAEENVEFKIDLMKEVIQPTKKQIKLQI